MIISTEQLTKVFRTELVETTALCEVALTVEQGEFVSLMGPSGCGKSTLLHVLGLIDTPTSGSYKFMGREMGNASSRERTRIRKENIGFVFQSFNLLDELTVFENVELPLLYRGVPAAKRNVAVTAVLEKMGMGARMRHHPVELSGGQQQRVAVARAVVGAPTLILADEPTGNLDSVHGDEVMNILRGLNKEGSTIVMVTHSQRDAAFADRIVHMLDGRIRSDESDRPRLQVTRSVGGPASGVS
jgi:putative ABC transport system ATP-binding protein